MLRAAERRRFRLYLSAYILEELDAVLGRPKFAALVAAHPRRVLVRRVMQACQLVKVAHAPRVVAGDPQDDPVLQCARVAKARYLLSLDPHLLEVGEHKGVLVVRPEAFAEALAAQGIDLA